MLTSYLRKVSPEEYLRLDAQNPYRSEHIDGFMFPLHDHGHTEPFTHLTSKHGLVCSNLHALLYAPARAAGLRLYLGNMRVKVQPIRALNGKWQQHFERPDLVATAENVVPTALHLTAPAFIAEVLSPRTRDKDRWMRLYSYLQLPSLTHYLLVDTATRAARLYTRKGDSWDEQYAEGEGTVKLSGPDVEIKLRQIYEGVTL